MHRRTARRGRVSVAVCGLLLAAILTVSPAVYEPRPSSAADLRAQPVGAIPSTTWGSAPSAPPVPVDGVPAEGTNGSFGSVAYTWDLGNDTVEDGAVNAPYSVGTDQLLYVGANDTLWIATGAPLPGEAPNLTLVNVSSNVTTILPGVGNVSAWAYSPSADVVYLTQRPPGASPSEFLGVSTVSGEIARVPTPLPGQPTALSYEPTSGALWISLDNTSGGNGSVEVTSGLPSASFQTVPVGVDPVGIAFDESAGVAYVADNGSGSIDVVGIASLALERSAFPVAGVMAPGGLSFDAADDVLVVAVTNSSNPMTPVSAIDALDPANGGIEESARIPGDGRIGSLTVDPTTGGVYATFDPSNGSDGSLWAWTPTGPLAEIASVGPHPVSQALGANGSVDFVGDADQVFVAAVSLVPGPALVRPIGFGAGPREGVYDPENGRVFVINSYAAPKGGGTGPDDLAELDPRNGTVAADLWAPANGVELDSAPSGIADDPASGRVIVALDNESSAAVLSAASGALLADWGLGLRPVGVADDPAHGVVCFESATGLVEAYNASTGATLEGWNGSTVAEAWAGPVEPLAIDPANDSVGALVPDASPTAESWLDFVTLGDPTVRQVALGDGAAAVGIAFDPLDGAMYVAESNGSLLAVNASSGSTVAETSLPGGPSYVAFDASRGAIEVALSGLDEVAVFNGSSPADLAAPPVRLATGPVPDAIIVGAPGGQLFVSNYGSGTVEGFSPVPEFASLTAHVDVPNFGELPAVLSDDDVGGPLYLDALAGGGVPPLSFSYSNLPTGCASSDTHHLVCVPSGAGPFSPTVVVTDSEGRSAGGATSLAVAEDPTVTASAQPLDSNRSPVDVPLHLQIAGGIAPYEFVVVSGAPGSSPVGGTTTSLAPPFVAGYPGPGIYDATVLVIDSLGFRATTAARVVIGAPLGVTVVPDSGAGPAPTAGEAVALRSQATGGIGPYAFVWEFPSNDTRWTTLPSGNLSSLSVSFPTAGTFPVRVTVTDATNASAAVWVNFSIGASGGTPPPPAVDGPLLAGVAGALAAAAAVAVLAWRRRRPRV